MSLPACLTVIFLFCGYLSAAVKIDDFRYTLGIGRNQLTSTEMSSSGSLKYLVYSGYARFGGDTSELFSDEALYSLGNHILSMVVQACLSNIPYQQPGKLMKKCDMILAS